MNNNQKPLCIYCGKVVGKVKKGEHLVPDAIGGTLTTKDVCGRCNNYFSDIDGELCSRSPLSIVAARRIDSAVWQAWDVDETSRTLLEARPDFERGGFKVFPQLLVFPSHIEYRTDHEEGAAFDRDRFVTLFNRRLKKLFWEHEHGNTKAFHLYRIRPSEKLFAIYRYPPRFFVRGSVADACGNKSIELRFVTQTERRLALASLESGAAFTPMKTTRVAAGSTLPVIRLFSDYGKVWRALAKIGINLLHHSCRHTPVNLHTFPQVIAEVRGLRELPLSRLREGGFIRARDIEGMKTDDGSHLIRFAWRNGWWDITYSFFGGEIGAFVRFQGPSNESWTTLDIRVPINSTDWTFSPMSFGIWSRLHIEDTDLTQIIPYDEWRWPN